MKKMFKQPHDIMLYQERTENEEFGHARKNYSLCPECHAVYYKKSWHHLGQLMKGFLKAGEKIEARTCPACRMIKDHQYEGMVTINNIPKKFQSELMGLIKSYTQKAYDQDCQHRLIAIDKGLQGSWVITTTENQLALKLGRKIQEVFTKVELTTRYSSAPDDLERVTVNFSTIKNR